MNIALIGPTGCGKSTLAHSLSEQLNLPIISTGDIARGMQDAQTQVALRTGAMAPEEAMRAMVKAAVEEADVKSGGWILEGFPRNVAQLVCLQAWTQAMPAFIHVDLPLFQCVERLVARGRPDDNPDSIARKLDYWAAETEPMVAMLNEGGVLQTLNYDGYSPDEGVDEIMRMLA